MVRLLVLQRHLLLRQATTHGADEHALPGLEDVRRHEDPRVARRGVEGLRQDDDGYQRQPFARRHQKLHRKEL